MNFSKWSLSVREAFKCTDYMLPILRRRGKECLYNAHIEENFKICAVFGSN
jgi:hypothetical protein